MSARLEKLAERLESLPEPGDILQKAQYSLLKVQGKVLARLPELAGDAAQKLQLLSTSSQTINTTAGMLGDRHEGVIILRKMMAIATAVVEGRPEPSDAELAKQFGGPGGPGGGCAAAVLIAAGGMGAVVGLAWL